MDIIFIRSLLTVVLFAAFIGIVFWAWSAKNKARFKEAAQLPFADDAIDNSPDNPRDHNGQESRP